MILHFAFSFSVWVVTVPTSRLSSQKDTPISRGMYHLRSHKVTETSITVARTALPGLASMVRSFIMTTPTTSHSHKPIFLHVIIVIFSDAVSTHKIRKSKVHCRMKVFKLFVQARSIPDSVHAHRIWPIDQPWGLNWELQLIQAASSLAWEYVH